MEKNTSSHNSIWNMKIKKKITEDEWRAANKSDNDIIWNLYEIQISSKVMLQQCHLHTTRKKNGPKLRFFLYFISDSNWSEKNEFFAPIFFLFNFSKKCMHEVFLELFVYIFHFASKQILVFFFPSMLKIKEFLNEMSNPTQLSQYNIIISMLCMTQYMYIDGIHKPSTTVTNDLPKWNWNLTWTRMPFSQNGTASMKATVFSIWINTARLVLCEWRRWVFERMKNQRNNIIIAFTSRWACYCSNRILLKIVFEFEEDQVSFWEL